MRRRVGLIQREGEARAFAGPIRERHVLAVLEFPPVGFGQHRVGHWILGTVRGDGGEQADRVIDVCLFVETVEKGARLRERGSVQLRWKTAIAAEIATSITAAAVQRHSRRGAGVSAKPERDVREPANSRTSRRSLARSCVDA